MSFKLTKAELSRRDEIVNDLRSHLEHLEQVLAVNSLVPDDISNAAASFQVVVSEAEEFRDEIATRLRDEWEDKSEKWQGSDVGEETEAFVDEWESADFSDCDLDLLDPEVDGLGDYADNLENLPTEL